MGKFVLTLSVLGLVLMAPKGAEARTRIHHGYHHHYGRYLAHYWHRHYHRHLAHYRHRTAPVVRHMGSLTTARLPDGQKIIVASSFVDRFVGFFADLFQREGRLPEIGCYAAHGHMRNSLHHWGGACDVGQQARNVAWRAMYHVTDLAHRWGLTDGATWRNPDGGHVEVNRAVAVVPAVLAVIAARRPKPTYQVAMAWPL